MERLKDWDDKSIISNSITKDWDDKSIISNSITKDIDIY
jgi:hypothetical protein